MAMTVEQIDEIVEQIYTDGNQSVDLGDGRKWTKYNIDELLKLREQLLQNAQTGAQGKSIIKVQLRRP